ncbi:MAG: ArsB/NhaD family transporter [Chloroflexi bacterium]|nr:ArsB/NhaD family transporter [Chloroflexota bacterium]
MWLGAAIFVVAYVGIASEKVHRTLVALLGGVVIILAGVIDQHQAFAGIDFNVIFLLAGMMIIANILGSTGVFQWMAIRSAKMARADPFRVLVALSTITAVVSAFLDNVTTVVLIVPMTLYIASTLRLSPMPFLIAEILASNIGGTATLIGDPPNLLIGSAAGLDFTAFLENLAPVVVPIYLAFLGLARLMLVRDLKVDPELRQALLKLDERDLITNPKLLRQGLIVLGAVIAGFLVHGALGYEAATIALAGAAVLLIWSRYDVHEALVHVEWTTLLFFVGLFMMVEGIVRVGLIEQLAKAALSLTGGNLTLTALLLLWLSAFASGVVDNIPYTATMIPLVRDLGQHMPATPLWWSLALGACLGGNLTIIGAAANVLVANLAERSGHPIRFGEFLPYGAIVTLVSMVISTVYVWARYLLVWPV